MYWANLDVFLLINIDAYLAKTNMDLTHLFFKDELNFVYGEYRIYYIERKCRMYFV